MDSLAGGSWEFPSYSLQKGFSLIIDGPSRVSLVSGQAECLGASLRQEGMLTVREDRRVPIDTMSAATVDVRLGKGGGARRVEGSAIPVGWTEASHLLGESPGTVVVLGDVDSGKSTFSTFLANQCARNGLKVGVVDADIGQADIGPPTTISFSRVSREIFSLQDLNPETAFFIGDTSPLLVTGKLLSNIAQLVKIASVDTDVRLVNTDGWVRDDEAVRCKLELLDNIRPDFVFGVASERELDPVLEVQQRTTLKMERSSYARTRSREERKKAREYGYRRFLQGAEQLEFNLGSVKLRRFDSHKQLRLGHGDLRGVISGLLADDDTLLSIGRVEGLHGQTITVRSRLSGKPGTIELGAVVLSTSFEELGFDA